MKQLRVGNLVLSLKSKNPVIPKSILDQYKVEKVICILNY